MANAEHVERLKAGVEEWNAWRCEAPDVKPELDGLRLLDADLEDYDLSYADLSGADLFQAHFTSANLRYAHLNNARLMESNFHNADLSHVTARNVHLGRSFLDNTNLAGADLCDATLLKADLSDANLTRSRLLRAKLFEANLCYANLTDSVLTGSHLYSANLLGCTLTSVDMEHAILGDTLFCNVDLKFVKGLESCRHQSPSSVDHRTLCRSGTLPISFLRGVGFSDEFIQYIPSLFGKGIEFYSCFISYNHADKDFARRLHDTLQGRGIRCWLDEKQMLPGEDIYEGIDHGIRMWDKVLLCASENSLKSWWVDNEIDTAFEKERKLMKQHGKKFYSLIPLNLDGHIFTDDWQSGKKRQVLQRVAADFTDWKTDHDKFEAEVEKVIAALRSDGGGKAPPPEPKLGVE